MACHAKDTPRLDSSTIWGFEAPCTWYIILILSGRVVTRVELRKSSTVQLKAEQLIEEKHSTRKTPRREAIEE